MSSFYNLTNDIMFKRFYYNPKCLADFLNLINKYYILFDSHIDEGDIEYLNDTELDNEAKGIERDIKFRISKNNTFYNFEMQRNKTVYDIGERMAYYHSTMAAKSFDKGEQYGMVRNISIWIFDYDDLNITNGKTWYDVYQLQGEKTKKVIGKKCITILAFFLKHLDEASIIEVEDYFRLYNVDSNECKKLETSIAKEGYEMLKKLNEDDKIKFLADSIRDRDLSISSDLYFSKQEGIELGKEQGIELGKQEKTIQIVKALYQNGCSLDLISKSTGLSVEEIKNIISE